MQRVIFLVTLCLGLGVALAGLAEQRQLSVTVSYLERIALPPDAVVDVELSDTSRADAPALRISAQRYKLDGVPQRVLLSYDDATIFDNLVYTVSARILSGERVLFRTTTANPVLTRGAGTEVELVLERAVEIPPQRVSGVSWALTQLGGIAIPAEDPPTIAFDEAGAFSIYGGCNRFTGAAEISGTALTFPPAFAGSLRACPEPRMTLERQFIDTIGRTARFERISDAEMRLIDTDSGTLARFRAAP
ncbi:MAG: YbaY family lipoprotein [Pseudomonadota bacterium]